ncbi:unnamed protein product [Aphanomyces euteiches]
MASRKHFQSSRDECTSQQALTSPDILQLICQFQPGLWEDMLPFLPLQALEQAYELTLAHTDEIGVVFGPWYNAYGLERIPRLLAALPFMKLMALAHCVRVGDKQLLQVIASISTEDIPRVRDFVGELVAIAIDSDQVDILAALECIGYTREIYKGELVFGIGDAVSQGHMTMADYLASEVKKIDTKSLKDFFNGADRARMKTNLTTIFATKTFEGLQWLLQVWTKLLPSTWMTRCRRDCRTLALQFEAWDILTMLTKDERNKTAKYDEDLIHAMRLALLEGVTWLLSSAGVVAKSWHIVEASKTFQCGNPNSSAILERLLANWLPTVLGTSTKVVCLDTSMDEALRRGYLEAIQVIWKMTASTSTLQQYGTPSTIREFAALGVFTKYVAPNPHWSCDGWVPIVPKDATELEYRYTIIDMV